MRLAKLNRTMSHRRALFRNLVSALIEHEQIKTTFPKAKAISRLADRVITWAKYGTENIFYQRKAESYLMNWVRLRKHLFHNLAKRYETRCGGYTRIHRLGYRTNDHAPLAIIELVDNARDLKRDKVIRTISRELAEIELSNKSTRQLPPNSSIQAQVPPAVWRNMPCKSEAQAKQAIEEFKRLLPALTKKNLQKVLSDQYVQAYEYCQPPQIPTKEEALLEVARIKKLRREALRAAVDGLSESVKSPTTSSSQNPPASKVTISLISPISSRKTKVGNLSHIKGIPRPMGPYTDFLYHVRLHFHRNLALLDPAKLGGRVNNGSTHGFITDEKKLLDEIVSVEK